ncbi:hypothetical protein B566_EDAN015449 [Ephemera danica]|nr:hypothetical protein B566_EDAN015449 [Ephemera danica]
MYLKSVLLAVFQQRSGFRLRDEKFLYGLGTPVPNPWLKNSIHLDSVLKGSRVVAYEEMRSRPSHEEAEQRAAYELACATSQRGHATSQKPPVTLFDLYDALKRKRSPLGSGNSWDPDVPDRFVSTVNCSTVYRARRRKPSRTARRLVLKIYLT